MKKNYLRRYVTHFKLIKTGDDIYSNTGGTSVLKIDNDFIFVRENTFKWNRVKISDIVNSILNNIPLHS